VKKDLTAQLEAAKAAPPAAAAVPAAAAARQLPQPSPAARTTPAAVPAQPIPQVAAAVPRDVGVKRPAVPAKRPLPAAGGSAAAAAATTAAPAAAARPLPASGGEKGSAFFCCFVNMEQLARRPLLFLARCLPRRRLPEPRAACLVSRRRKRQLELLESLALLLPLACAP
jgi:hypothetical protein